jgi:hypothetical protein
VVDAVYAALEPQTTKGRRANDVILRAAPRGILARRQSSNSSRSFAVARLI